MDGLLLVDKPKGMTSHDVVDRVRRILNTRKVGHTGTLDPSATGLLLVCVGKATRLTPFLQGLDKEYQGVMIFGVTTSSLDEEGEILEEKDASALKRSEVEDLFAIFRGKIAQTPPAFSAVHWKGERLYKLAREGRQATPPPATGRNLRVNPLGFYSGPSSSGKIQNSLFKRDLCEVPLR